MRKHYLDNVRWLTVVLVVIYHVFYMFNGLTVGVIGPFAPVQWQDAILHILYPWFMVLLFIVSGMCFRFSLEHTDEKTFLKSRTRRLLVPSTIGLFVFQWIQGYFNMAIGGAFDTMPEMPLIIKYLIMSVSGTGVLWYIQLLWLFSVLLLLVRKVEKDRLWSKCGGVKMWLILLFVIPMWCAAQILNTPVIVVYRFGIYGLAFFLGYFVFSHDEVTERVEKCSAPLIIAAIVLAVIYVWINFGKNYAENPVLNSPFSILYCWAACLAILGGMKKHFDFETPFTAFMSKRSFGLYVFHYLTLSAAAYYLHNCTSLGALPSYLICAVAAFAGGYLLNEIISRIPFLRWAVLGIKKVD